MYATATLGSLSLLATIFEATTVPPASAQHTQTQRWSPMCARMRFSLRHVVVANSVCRTLNIYKNILSCILFTRKFDITWSPLPFVKRLHSVFRYPIPTRKSLPLRHFKHPKVWTRNNDYYAFTKILSTAACFKLSYLKQIFREAREKRGRELRQLNANHNRGD